MKQSTQEYIVSESLALFLKQGLKSVRMDDIATQLSVSKRTIYELFKDRKGLVGECVHLHLTQQDKVQDQIDTLSTVNVIETFLVVIDNWEHAMDQSINFLTELEKHYPELHQKIHAERYQIGINRLKSRLKRGQQEGIFLDDINLEFAAHVLSNSIQNIFLNPNPSQTSNISLPEAFRYIIMCFFRGIATANGIALIDEMMQNRYNKQQTTNRP